MLLKRPITAIMLVIATFIFGYVALTELSVDLLPDVDAPSLMVRAEWPGASPQEVERRINQELEAGLRTLPGLQRTQSFARQGLGYISLEYEWGHDMDMAFLNAREQLDRMRFRLPEQAERPELVYSNPGDEPVAVLGVTAEGRPDPDYETRRHIKQWTDRVLSRRLEQQDGIAEAVMVGELTPQMQIRYDPRMADRYDLSIGEIASSVEQANAMTPSGEMQDGWYRYALTIQSRIGSVEELRRMPVRTVGGERILRLEDVAEVQMGERDPTSFSMVDGSEMLTVLVKKDYDSNLVQVYQQMLPVLEEVRGQFPDMSVEVLSENATFIDNSIRNLLQTLLLGGILAFFVLFFFLNDPRMPFTIGIAIPVSIFLTFFVMYLAGIHLNIISLSGLTLGIGLLVDNAIVVLENIKRHKTAGVSQLQAARSGTKEIGLAVTASTLTTISVFLPLVFLGGFEGAFFRDQALTLSIALLASLLVALLILPVLLLQFKGRKADLEEEAPPSRFTRTMDRIRDRYEGALERVTRRPLPFAGAFLGAAALAGLAFVYVPKEMIPSGEEHRVRYQVTLPGNTSLQSTREAAGQMESEIREQTGARGILAMGGYTDETNIDRLAREGLNRFTVDVPVDSPGQARQVRRIVDRLNASMDSWSVEPLSGLPLFENLLGRNPAPVLLHLVGEDRGESERHAERLREKLAGQGREWGLDLQHAQQVQTYQLHFRPEMLMRYDLDEQEVIRFMESTARGVLVSEWQHQDESIDIRLLQNPQTPVNPEQITLRSRGRGIPLSELADIRTASQPEQLERIDQTPVLSYMTDISLVEWWTARSEFRELLEAFRMETGLDIELSGTALQVESLLADMGRLLLISILLIYMILAVQYENLKYPLIIMIGVPFAWIGSLLILYGFGQSLNILSFMGILILTGIAVNDSILKVDFMRRYYGRTGNLDEAIRRAGRHRFRPVVMTSLTTILGLMPMVVPFGDGYEFRLSLALALMGGMITSTLLTLFLVPTVFRWVERFSTSKPEPIGDETY